MQTIYVPARTIPHPEGGHSAHNGFDASRQSPTRSAKAQIEQLLTANRLKDEFMAILAHELRTPLAALHNAVHILSADTGQDPRVQQKLHALIERQLRHMVRLASGLQDISSISLGQLRLQRERIDLRVVLADAIETMEPELQQRAHHVTTRWPDAPVWLQGDPDRLDQVFQNLLSNASKYTNPAGDLTLSLLVHDHHAVVRAGAARRIQSVHASRSGSSALASGPRHWSDSGQNSGGIARRTRGGTECRHRTRQRVHGSAAY